MIVISHKMGINTLPETKNRKSISAIAHEISAFTFGLEPWDTLYIADTVHDTHEELKQPVTETAQTEASIILKKELVTKEGMYIDLPRLIFRY